MPREGINKYQNISYQDYLALQGKLRGVTPLSMAVFSSCTLEPLEPVLKAELAFEDWDASFDFYGFNIFEQELLSEGKYQATNYDAILLFFTLEQFFPELIWSFAAFSPQDLEKKMQEVISRVKTLIEAARKNKTPRIILTTFDLQGERPYYGILDRGLQHSQQEVLLQLNRSLAQLAASFKDIFVLDVQEGIARVGREQAYDRTMEYHGSLPFSSKALVEFGKEIKRILFAAYGKTKKCLIVDLDNTLWGGVLGEEGVEGVVVGPAGPGKAYYDFQRELKLLSSKGTVLAIASKNNPEDVEEMFSRRKDDMPLKLDDFVIRKIGWDFKEQYFQEIAQELDIGLDSMVFLDDSPVEREMIRQQLPEVYTPELPENASSYSSFVRDLYVFEKAVYSSEDLKKVQIYKEQGKRAELKQRLGSLEDFWKGLEMRLAIFLDEKSQIQRLTQLTQKTNQFNATTRRYSESEVERFIDDSSFTVFSWAVQDRFGDNGIVGLIIAEVSGNTARIDVFLQSCRVIGRTIEEAVFAQVAAYLKNQRKISRGG